MYCHMSESFKKSSKYYFIVIQYVPLDDEYRY